MHGNEVLEFILFAGPDYVVDVVEYLILSLNKMQIYQLGLVLGISHNRLEDKKESNTFLYDMIGFWLNQVDRVADKGKPSWVRLAQALKNPTLGQVGLAKKIIDEHP